MNDDLDVFNDEVEYPVTKIGSFGRFVTSKSFPIDYVLTTFTPDEIDKTLTLARDINPDTLDFELMMQRDIDEERVLTKIEPYLRAAEAEVNSVDQVVFFPPILAAVVPVEGTEMKRYYKEDTVRESNNRYIREWKPQFKATFVKSMSTNAYPIEVNSDNFGTHIHVNKASASLEFRLATLTSMGVKLVVIDGQHRVRAIQMLYQKKPEAIKDLVLPVCLLFPSNSNERYLGMHGDDAVPTVPEVFRKLFVDVNNTAELVGGHFNILLSDNNIGSLICRDFCSQLLETKGVNYLATIEWNTKKKKDSSQIKRKYSVTSIGVLDLALKEVFAGKKNATNLTTLAKYLLKVDAVSDKLDLEKDEDGEGLTWNSFSLGQGKIIQKQITDNVYKNLYKIFYEVEEFKKAANLVVEVINKYQRVAESSHESALDWKVAIDSIVNYKPTKNTDALKNIKTFELEVEEARKKKVAPIVGFSVFHRSIIEAWSRVLSYGPIYSLSPELMTDAFVYLLDKALENKGELFSRERAYMLHSVFGIGGNISPTTETKRSLANLIFAKLGNDGVVKEFVGRLGLNGDEALKLTDKITDLAITSASAFLDRYEENRRKFFEKSYSADFSIPADERAELSRLQDIYELHLKEVKNKTRSKNDVSNEFFKKVSMYVGEDLERAYVELRKYLGYDEEILSYSSILDEESEDEDED